MSWKTDTYQMNSEDRYIVERITMPLKIGITNGSEHLS